MENALRAKGLSEDEVEALVSDFSQIIEENLDRDYQSDSIKLSNKSVAHDASIRRVMSECDDVGTLARISRYFNILLSFLIALISFHIGRTNREDVMERS
ncbi:MULTISPECIES: hypothetical protein [Pacificimonas]|nr:MULTISPECIES: hypothetical protein [Pacificimonas]MBZ6379962.1 hypothetical protein [Pacificimonas aurantium]